MLTKANPIWDYFERSESDRSKGVCKTVALQFRLVAKKENIRQWRHCNAIFKIDTDVFAKFTDEKKAAASASSAPTADSSVEPSPSLQLRQPSLQESFAMGRKWDDKDPRSDE